MSGDGGLGLFEAHLASSVVSGSQCAVSGTCEVPRRVTLWLGYSAFEAALGCRSGVYASVLRGLGAKAIQLEGAVSVGELERARLLVQECNGLMSQAQWV